MTSGLGRALAALATFATLATAAVPASGQSAGTITGHVTDRNTQRPVVDATVFVSGTQRGARTGEDGSYRIGGVAPGTVQVRVQRVGYETAAKTVTVAAGETATVDFAIGVAAVTLQEVVSTTTGQQRKVELGTTAPVIDAAKLAEEAPVTNIGTLLAGRTANVSVQQGASTGAGTRIRIRGATSLSLSNEPVVFVDGIRVESGVSSSSIGVGGTTPSRLNDLNPDEIESIEIVKGPSAATLYGTNAANGVINIRTKRGAVGQTRWMVFGEAGTVEDVTRYPDAYYYYGHKPGQTANTQCFLSTIAAGTCIGDRLVRFNPLMNSKTRPFAPGNRQKYGAQARGGSDMVRFYLSAESEGEIGVNKMPGYEVQRLAAERGAGVPHDQIYPNELKRTSLRANLDASVTPKADVNVSTMFVMSDLRLPQSDNNSIGLFSNALGGPGLDTAHSSLGVPLYGYRQLPPGDIYSHTFQQSVNRFIGSTNAAFRPFTWLQSRGTVGLDFTERRDQEWQYLGQGPHVFGLDQGQIADNRTEIFQYTADWGATASFQLPWQLASRSSAGVQYYHHVFDRNGAAAEQLSVGIPRVDAGAVKSADQSYDADKTLGGYVEQMISYRERLWVTGAMRFDNNSAFGKNFGAVRYPKVSLSWLTSDESWFPHASWLGEVRLRAAYGQSGLQPGTNDAARYYASEVAVLGGQVMPGLTIGALGNAQLKPERTAETEFGADIGLLDNRFNIELTHYNKRTRDALISRPQPPSLGGPSSRFENLGAVRNVGDEAVLRGVPLQLDVVDLDFAFSWSRNKNTLLRLGEGIPPIVGSTVQEREGYPLFGYWQRPYTYADTAGGGPDGIIANNEVTIADSAVFVGSSQPTHEWSLNTGLDLLQKRVRLSLQFDHKGGNKLLNGTQRIRCQSRNNCRESMDPTSPLWMQARAIAVRKANGTQYGFMEDASFTKLREVSLTLTAPTSWAARVRASSASLTLSGRNLHTWTKYTGLDPENNYGQGDIPSDFQTLPPPRYLLVRLNLGL